MLTRGIMHTRLHLVPITNELLFIHLEAKILLI